MATILIIDDSSLARGRMRDVLSSQGHQVKEAANGRDALSVVERLHPDCILVDLMMPEMGGLDFLRRQSHRKTRPPVVVLHTDFPESTRDACRAAGAVDFLLKPIDDSELTAAVRDAVALGTTTRG